MRIPEGYATELLEAGVDLLTISRLLGHASFATSMVYLHCRQEHMLRAPSPLDWLPVGQLPTYRPPVQDNNPDNNPDSKPDQLTKTRYFGGWSNNQLTAYQEACVSMMNAAEVPLSAEAMQFPPLESEPSEFESDCSSAPKCPSCGEAALRILAYRARPSWSDLLSQGSTHLPIWHRKSLELDDERFWDGCYGAGFNAWYLENVVESAYRRSAALPSATQMMLAGLETSRSDALE